MWQLPEPTRPNTLPDGEPRWDPPVLVRLSLDHGLDAGAAPLPARTGPRSPGREGRRRPTRG